MKALKYLAVLFFVSGCATKPFDNVSQSNPGRLEFTFTIPELNAVCVRNAIGDSDSFSNIRFSENVTTFNHKGFFISAGFNKNTLTLSGENKDYKTPGQLNDFLYIFVINKLGTCKFNNA